MLIKNKIWELRNVKNTVFVFLSSDHFYKSIHQMERNTQFLNILRKINYIINV